MSFFPTNENVDFGGEENDGTSAAQHFSADAGDMDSFPMEHEADPQALIDFDLSTVALPELLQEISHNLIGDLKEGAPDVLKALMKQEPTHMELPPQSKTEELSRATAFIDDSGTSEQSGFQPSFNFAKSEEVLDDRNDTVMASKDTKDDNLTSTLAPSSGKTMSNASNTGQAPSDSTAEKNGVNVNGGAKKKAIRAERNRQSAAASRERKKHHIRELERRVSMLSMENAHLQVEQYDKIRARIEEEKKLTEENQRLKNQLVFLDMKINQLAKQMHEAGVKEEKGGSRAKTWTPGDFSAKKK